MSEIIDIQAEQLEQSKKRITELVELIQKMHKRMSAASGADRIDKPCKCVEPKLVRNTAGPAGKDLCYNCDGWG